MFHRKNSIESVIILYLLIKNAILKISGNFMKNNKTIMKIKFLKRYYKTILNIEICIITNY